MQSYIKRFKTCHSHKKLNMSEKIVLVTGATDGIGKETATRLSHLGYSVIVHGRTEEKAKTAAREISHKSGNKVKDVAAADFSSLNEVKDMALEILKKYDKLDVLINNAGVYKKHFETSREGFELTFAVNHLAPFVLTLHLLPLIKAAPEGRIVNVASMAHSSSINLRQLNSPEYFGGYSAYGDSKLCNILFTYYLANLAGEDFTVNALHPGVISTKLLRAGFSMGGRSVAEGAETSVYLATSNEVSGVSGHYFSDSKPRKSASVSYDKDVQKELWQKSLEWTREFLPADLPGKFNN